jgi:hypothetical protein
MATTTPNFGWPVPTSTDLVKDGATAIEALGDGIDTSMVDLKGGLTGQVLAKATNADMDFAWVAQDDSNAIQNSIVDAKGDLIAATADDTPARLAVGSNFAFLQANSTPSTGLAWNNDAFISYTPTIVSGAGTLTTASVVGKYQRIGKVCIVKIAATITTAGTGSGTIQVSLPFNSANDGNTYAAGSFRENNVTGLTGVGRVTPNSTALNISKYDDTTFIADGRLVVGTITYEVA